MISGNLNAISVFTTFLKDVSFVDIAYLDFGFELEIQDFKTGVVI